MRVLLTGATGYIGSAIAEALQVAGHHVVGLARTDSAAQQLHSKGIDVLRGDVRSPEGWTAAIAGTRSGLENDRTGNLIEGVIHTAATKDVAMPQTDHLVVESILSAMSGTHKPFLYTSGTWILGNVPSLAPNSPTTEDIYPPNPIPLMAWRVGIEAQVLAAQDQVRSVIIRPGMVYGRGGGMVAQLVASGQQTGTVPLVGTGDNHWALVHVEDLARCYVLALEQSPAGKIFNAASDSTLTLRDIAHLASKAAGVPGRVQAQSVEAARQEQGLLVDGLILDQQLSGFSARQLLSWCPSAPTLSEELARGSYTRMVRVPKVEDYNFS